MRKIICLCMAVLIMCSLTACGADLNHYSKKESEVLMEEVLGQDVTYISTDRYPKEKKVVHLFHDEAGLEFAVISELRQGWFQVGAYRCEISDNYVGAKSIAYSEEIMDILEEHGLKEHLNNEFTYFTEDVSLGEAVNPDVLYFELPIGTVEENKEIVAKMAAAGAQIDELLSICYDEDYALDVDLEGGDYQNYVSYAGMNLRFTYESVGFDGRVYERSDLMTFEWSLKEEDRWSEEKLYDFLESQLTKAIGKEEEE